MNVECLKYFPLEKTSLYMRRWSSFRKFQSFLFDSFDSISRNFDCEESRLLTEFDP